MRLLREMGIRGAIGLLWAAAVAGAVLVLAIAALVRPEALAAGGTGVPVGVVWAALAVLVLAMAGLWALTDRVILARLHDRRGLPARPEFRGGRGFEQPFHGDELDGRKLAALRYVVFDTETTGLRPSEGDEIISIAAVRCRDGAVEEADAFSRLVNPGRPIPRASIRFHGIADDMVAGEAPIGEVLPAFRAYVGDAVLVAHNADFDMTFLRLKEAGTGIEFANVVLDTLLISVFLDPLSRNHSLDAIAERLGVAVEGRHTALGDSIATARVFCKMLPRLEARGIATLGQVLQASARIRRRRGLDLKY